MADLNLQEIHDFMISIAKQAGERIVSAKPTTENAGSKKNCEPLKPTLGVLQS
jgi:myo-inositol-1(or 4)-monophosphatase